MSFVHVALRFQGDILAHEPFTGASVSEQSAIDCVPDSVYMFLNLLLGGQKLLDGEFDDLDTRKQESLRRCRILSLAQDMIYTLYLG